MSGKFLSILALSVAIVVAALAGVAISDSRADRARDEAKAAETRRSVVEMELRKLEISAEIARQNVAKSNAMVIATSNALEEARIKEAIAKREAQSAEDNRIAAQIDFFTAKTNAVAKQMQLAIAQKNMKAARDHCQMTNRAAQIAETKARSAERAAAAERDAAKFNAEKAKIEERLLELRKTDFEKLAAELQKLSRELEERERALQPQLTVADLEWVEEREADVIGGETNATAKAEKVLPENNRKFPRETRQLAKRDRLRGEELAAAEMSVRKNVLPQLERRYVESLFEDRVIDAQHYLKCLRAFDPNWKPAPRDRLEELFRQADASNRTEEAQHYLKSIYLFYPERAEGSKK